MLGKWNGRWGWETSPAEYKDGVMSSKNDQRIRSVCDELGIKVNSLVWENVTRGCEMEGYYGGWLLNDFYPIGLSTDAAIATLRECREGYGGHRRAFVSP